MREITINPKYTKTYKTKDNLYKALEELNLPDNLSYLLCEVNGRFTAVFINNSNSEMYLSLIIHKGFMIVG